MEFLRRPPFTGKMGLAYRMLFASAVATIPRRYRRLLGVRRTPLPVITATRVVLAVAERALNSGGPRANDRARERLRRLRGGPGRDRRGRLDPAHAMKSWSMRIALTGSSGKLGTVVLRELRDAGHDVVGLDVVGTRGPGFLQVDLTDYGQVVDALTGVHGDSGGFDAVVHLAAIPAPGIRSDIATFRNNMPHDVRRVLGGSGARHPSHRLRVERDGARACRSTSRRRTSRSTRSTPLARSRRTRS